MSPERIGSGTKLLMIIAAAAAAGLVGMIGYLLTQSFDWNRWRGSVDLRLPAIERRVDRVESRMLNDLSEIKALIRSINDKLDRKADK